MSDQIPVSNGSTAAARRTAAGPVGHTGRLRPAVRDRGGCKVPSRWAAARWPVPCSWGSSGGTSLIWLQLVAIIMGVVMLSAISYVTLSTGKRPFREINQHINPVLGWGWLIATCMANMIWCMPQFSLCYAALHENLLGPERVGDSLDGQTHRLGHPARGRRAGRVSEQPPRPGRPKPLTGF